MGKTGRPKAKLTAERRDFLAAMNRRKYLLSKERKGTLAEDERGELAAILERHPLKAAKQAEVDTEDQQPQDGPVATEGAGDSPPPESPAPPPPPPRVKVEAPPRTEASATRGSWRDKYRAAVPAATREGSCREAAAAICGGLKKANAATVAAGRTPIIPDEMIDTYAFNAWVLVVDRFMPDIDLGPEWVAAGISGTIIGQAIAARRSASKAAPKKEDARVLQFVQPLTNPKPEEVKVDPAAPRSAEVPPAAPEPPPPVRGPDDYLA